MDYKSLLNENQYEAVTSTYQYNRVIAGAGSGKTRVLTYRIAYLVSEMNIKPWNILAITFTNKVAGEMKSRIVKLLPESEKDLMIRTFHSFAAYFLRIEISSLGYPSCFSILDDEDQLKMIKDIGSALGYKKTDPIIKKAISYISSNKIKELAPEDITISFEKFSGEKDCLEIYTRYEEDKLKMFALDFDDLLLKTNQILTKFPEIRTKWQNKISHILIDEFQDTNDVEYRLIKLLSKPSTSLYVVGDPDQTIYTWRGAKQDIIMNLDKDYPGLETIILDRNYRSTQIILNSANKLIDYNKFRVKKNLYTENGNGTPIIVRAAPSGSSEADYVAREINKLVSVEGYKYSDITLLYRSNYITVEFEQAFAAHNIPYVIYGGLKFYQRKEIKDVLSYFRLLTNSKDDVAFERIINVPKRGIGESSFNQLKKEAQISNLSLYDYSLALDIDHTELPSRVINSLKCMTKVMEVTKSKLEEDVEVYSKTLEEMLNSFGYYDYLVQDDDGEERLENVKALFQDLRHYLRNHPESSFDEYLQNIALISSQDELTDTEKVNLMTVHTAKGLEFPVVFIVRFNDGVFPNQRALSEGSYKALEEERRLAYVAMTRAKYRLYLCCADGYSYVMQGDLRPSQFFKESGNLIQQSIPEYNPNRSNKGQHTFHFDDGPHIDNIKQEPIKQDFDDIPTNGISSWSIGDVVIHKKLGRGVVIALEGDDIIKVHFDEHGDKSILGNHPAVSKGGKDA